MNYFVLSCTLRNLKLMGMRANSVYDLIRSKPFLCQGLIVLSLNLKVLSMNQNPIIYIELPSFVKMKGASFMLDTLEDVMDMVAHCSHTIETFCCGARGEFAVIIEVYGAWIKAIETLVGGDYVSGGGSGVVGNFSKR